MSRALTEDTAVLAQLGIGAELPGRAELAGLLGVSDSRALAMLRVLIARCRPDATTSEHLLAIEQLARFVVAGKHGTPAERLELLVLAVERVPAAHARIEACLSAVLAATSAERLFAVVGLPNDRGLFAETADRLADRMLPAPPDEGNLAELAARIIRTADDHAWLTADVDELIGRLGTAFGDVWAPLRRAAADAVGLIAIRVAALGTGDVLRGHRLGRDVQDSRFYAIGRGAIPAMSPLVDNCRVELDRIRVELEDVGVSVQVVYTLDAIARALDRIDYLLPLATGTGARPAEIRQLLASLARGVIGERSFGQLMSDNLRLLARKVIERAGRTGEHYVASSRREYWSMLRSAAGGGVITAATAVTKFLIKWHHLPLFIDGVASSMAYAASFLLIQFLGFTLATKQPSMTAAALAGTIRDGSGPDRLDELLALIARIARSQFAAAVGNVGTVIVVMLLFDYGWKQMFGHTFLDAGTAKGTIASFHPLRSGTIPFAALTGVLLWMSSLVAGWFENWLVYRRIPEGIEHHRLGKRFGRARMAKIARGLERHAAGVGGSVSLGFLLGMTSSFAKFVGLPIDVRHVTLSSGALTLAISATGPEQLGWGPIIWAWAGIAIIGLLNFGVSFALALVVAMRARDVPADQRRGLPWAVLRRFVSRPLSFFFPPRDPPASRPPTATAH